MVIKKIHSKRVALLLIRRGHDFVYCEPHKKNERLTVFFFEDTKKLNADLTEILS
ncbi:hypothetical protein ACQKN7_10735 [Bacillus cereus]|uniref:hypothetical protein n=1 Tax=Bacillus cereus TaxID=1396 RepID=UPI003D046376